MARARPGERKGKQCRFLRIKVADNRFDTSVHVSHPHQTHYQTSVGESPHEHDHRGWNSTRASRWCSIPTTAWHTMRSVIT
eukprot:1257242-Prymnesium_polylepis.2